MGITGNISINESQATQIINRIVNERRPLISVNKSVEHCEKIQEEEDV